MLSVLAVSIAAAGGLLTFWVAAGEIWAGIGHLLAGGDDSFDNTVIYVVKSIDSVLLSLVQFLLAAYLWQMLDPAESLLNEENMERLEEAKQILCKVVLVILAVRMLGEVIQRHEPLQWQLLVYPAGIVSLALATSMMAGKRVPGSWSATGEERRGPGG